MANSFGQKIEPYWSDEVVYIPGDLVTEGAVSYVCILKHINQQPPSATYWAAQGGGGGGGGNLGINELQGMQLLKSLAGAAYFEVTPGARRSDDDTDEWSETFGNLTKRIDQLWAQGDGNGSMDTGTAPGPGTLHVYSIYNPTTTVADYLTSDPAVTTPGSPVLPAGFTKQRYIGSLLTIASNNIRGFSQHGDTFYISEQVEDSQLAGNRTFGLFTLTYVPKQVRVIGIFRVEIGTAGPAANRAIIADPYQSSVLTQPERTVLSAVSVRADTEVQQGTDLQGRIFYGTTGATGGNNSKRLLTRGWVDDRLAFTPYHDP